jgi:small conductance mechanosensitive channel
MDVTTLTTFITTTGWAVLTKITAALVFWIIGRWLIRKVSRLAQAGMTRNKIDPTLTKYLGSIIAIVLNIALVMGILGYSGVQTTSFATLLAGAGVAIGAA